LAPSLTGKTGGFGPPEAGSSPAVLSKGNMHYKFVKDIVENPVSVVTTQVSGDDLDLYINGILVAYFSSTDGTLHLLGIEDSSHETVGVPLKDGCIIVNKY
jgi:hypothetical protein